MVVADLAVAGALGACATAPAPAPAPSVTPRARKRPAPPPPPPPAEAAAPAPAAVPPPAPDEPAPPPAAPPATSEPPEEGVASYYADSLAGRRTASGERYRPDVATCAHRTHRFGTTLVVTAVGSGRSAQCRVNDRGPWVKGRVLDVSKVVAKKLGMLGPGVLSVRIEVARAEAE